MDKDKEQIIYKRSGFRMWKSGKHWLYGLGAASAIFLSTSTQTFAESVEPNLNLPPENQTVLADTGETVVEESSTEDSPQPVSEETLAAEELLTPANEDTTSAVVENSQLANQTAVEQETAPVADPQVEEETSEEPEETSEPSQDEDFKKKIVPISSAIFQDEDREEDKAGGEKLTKLRANQERSAEEPLDITTTKPVTIYYEPSSDTDDNYYIYVWGDGLDSSMQGQDLKMERHGDKQFKLTITPKEDATSFNYIIKKGGSGIWTDKRTGDMVATVNSFTETDIYVGDNWYSQLTNLQTDDFDRKFGYEDKRVSADAEDKFETVGSLGRLGATLNEDGTATINLWAPTAKEVSLNLYTDLSPEATASHQVQMVRGTDYNPDDHTTNTVGVWTYTISAEDLASMGIDTANKLAYDYSLTLPNSHFIQVEFTNNGKVFRNSATMESIQGELSREEIAAFYAKGGAYQTVTTQDPYSYALIQSGGRSVILDVSKVGEAVTHTANEDRRASTNSQVSVLEVNVRDFSIDPSSGVSEENRGNYLGFVEAGTTNPNTGAVTGIDYLKYLGVNYVQLMPVNDFETVPELDKDDPENNTISQKEPDGVHENQQNWGYDPKNYNVPDGSYASDPADPENRIAEFKTMIQGLHDAGINVIQDVVYNHLYHSQKNVFEQTVPGYYYAVNMPDNVMNNDIFVGNAVRANSEMMRRYIVNSTAYWAAEYGIDGFRFDAMSDLDITTLNAVRDALDMVHPNLVTYGEGWDSMGKYLPTGQNGSDTHAKNTPTYGFFDAESRNSIVGHAYNEHLDAPGFANEQHNDKGEENPNIANPGGVAQSLTGGNRWKYGSASQQLNYVECHDGMTLSDILKRYNPGDIDNPDQHLNRVELATAMSALAQGIHFSQHGQEFLRTKNGEVNTYNAGDEYNRILWDQVSQYPDAVNFTKALTQLRQAEPLFQMSDYDEIDAKMKITNNQPSSGIITYELRLDETPEGQAYENKNGKYLVVFNNNTQEYKPLKLGVDSWFYGTQEGYGYQHNAEGHRGILNEHNQTNDFTNAYIVATNSKSLYDRIGEKVGESSITLDYLSATVLFIPAPAEAIELETVDREIEYVNTKGETVATKHTEKVSYLIVEETEPSLKFGFEESGIPTNDADLGHNREEIVNSVVQDTPKVQRLYIAQDKNGNNIDASSLTLEKIAIDDLGKPVDTDTIIWKLATDTAYYSNAPKDFAGADGFTTDREEWLTSATATFSQVDHPKVDGYQVKEITPETAGDLTKTNKDTVDWTVPHTSVKVIYAKEADAVIISSNDPAKTLPTTADAASGDYRQDGFVDDAVKFSIDDTNLARPGYRYTVNGEDSLADAISKSDKLAEDTRIFEVVYEAITGSVVVNYVDANDQPITAPETGNQSSLTVKAENTLIDTEYDATNFARPEITVNGEKYYLTETQGKTADDKPAELSGKVTEGQTTLTLTYQPAKKTVSEPVDTTANLTVIVVADGQEIAKKVTEHVIAQTTTTTLTKPDDTVISETESTTPVDAPYDVTAEGKSTITLNDKTYYLVETTGQTKGNLTQDTTVTFTYKPAIEEIEVEESKATLTVKFVDDNGVELAQPVTQEFVVGKTTTTTILHPNGNELDHDFEVEHLPASYDVSDLAKESLDIDAVTYQLLVTEGELKGTLTADKTIVLTYQPLDITTSWVDTEGNTLKDDEKGVAEAGEFDGYVFVMTATDDNGNAKHFFFKKPEPEIIEVEKEVEVVKEVPVEKIVEVIKVVPTEVPVEVVKEVPVEKVVEVIKEVEVEKIVEITKEVPVETIKTVVTEVPVEVIKEVPVEIIKTVPVEVIKEIPVEVIKTVEVEKLIEVIKEVPTEIIKEVPVEIIKTVPVEVIKEIPVEVIKTVEVEKLIEVIKEVPTEIIKEVPVEIIKTVPVEVIKEIPVEVIKTVEVEKLIEVTKEIPVEVVKTVVTEVPVEVVKTVVTEVPVEVIKTIEVEKLIEVIKEVPTEVIKEVPVEIIKTVPVEVIKEIPVEVIKTVEVEKLIEVTKEIPVEVVKTVVTEVPVEVIKTIEVEKLIEVIKEVPTEVIKEVPVEIIKTVPVEVIKTVEVEKLIEVIKEVPTEIIKEVPVEIIKTVPVEVIKEIPVEVVKTVATEVPVEVIKTIEVEKLVEIIKEVPTEVIKEVPVEIIKTVPVEVIKEIPVEVIKTVEVEKLIEVTKEIPVEVVKTVVTEVPVEVIKTIEVEKLIEVTKEIPVEVVKTVVTEVPVEVIKTVEVEKLVEIIKEVPVEIIKTVPVEVIKEIPVEVIKTVVTEIPVEVIREVPVERIVTVIQEVPVETIKEITKTVEVEKIVEVIKEVPVDRIVEVIKEVPVDRIVEVTKEVPVEKIVEVIKEVPTEVIKEVPVEIIKTVPVEVIKEIPVEVIKTVEVEKLIEVIKEVPTEVIKEVPVEIIKTVPVEVIKEVPVEVIKEVPTEIIKEVPVEIIKTVPVEVIKEIPVEVVKTVVTEVPVEVIKTIEVEKLVEIIKEVPTEIIKEVPVEIIKTVPVEVIKEIPVEVIKTVEVEKLVEVIKEVPTEVIKEVPVEIIKTVPVEVIKEVPVDRIVEVIKEVPVDRIVEITKEVPVEKIVEVIKEVPVASTSPEAIEENLELYGSVLARYMTEDGIALEEDTVVLYNALVGEHYDTVEKEFDGYECYCVDEAGAPASGEVHEGEQVVTYLYRAVLNTEEEVAEETPALVTEPDNAETEEPTPSQAEPAQSEQEIEAKGNSVAEDALPEFPVDQVPENSTEKTLVDQEVTEEPSQEPVNSEPQPTSSPKQPESKQPSLLGGAAIVAPTSQVSQTYRRSDRHNKATKRQQDEQASLPNTGDSNNRLATLGTSLILTSFGLLGNRRRKED